MPGEGGAVLLTSGRPLCPPPAADVLLFFKMYDPRLKQIAYCGHTYMPITVKASE